MSTFKDKRTEGAKYKKDESGYQPPPEILELDPRKLRPPPKVTERKVPTVYREIIKVEWFRQFTFLERLKILLGYNMVVLTGVATQHKPGEFQPLVLGLVTKQRNASNYMQAIVNTMIEERAPKTPEAQAAAANADKTDGRQDKV